MDGERNRNRKDLEFFVGLLELGLILLLDSLKALVLALAQHPYLLPVPLDENRQPAQIEFMSACGAGAP